MPRFHLRVKLASSGPSYIKLALQLVYTLISRFHPALSEVRVRNTRVPSLICTKSRVSTSDLLDGDLLRSSLPRIESEWARLVLGLLRQKLLISLQSLPSFWPHYVSISKWDSRGYGFNTRCFQKLLTYGSFSYRLNGVAGQTRTFIQAEMVGTFAWLCNQISWRRTSLAVSAFCWFSLLGISLVLNVCENRVVGFSCPLLGLESTLCPWGLRLQSALGLGIVKAWVLSVLTRVARFAPFLVQGARLGVCSLEFRIRELRGLECLRHL